MTTKAPRFLSASAAYLCFAISFAAACHARDVPYVPTPEKVVQQMLRTAGVGPGDVVFDLGSGDGRIAISAVRDFGAERAIGIEIDPRRIWKSRENAEAAGVSDRAKFVQQDIFEADFGEATVLTMYLLPSVNLRLRPRILSELKPGSRVVSHDFSMGDWQPDETVTADGRKIHLWVVPARVAGTWRWSLNGEEFRLDLTQHHQNVAGAMVAGSGQTPVSLEDAQLVGDRLRLEGRVRQGAQTMPVRLDGQIAGDRFSGVVTVNGQTSRVSATRLDGGAVRIPTSIR